MGIRVKTHNNSNNKRLKERANGSGFKVLRWHVDHTSFSLVVHHSRSGVIFEEGSASMTIGFYDIFYKGRDNFVPVSRFFSPSLAAHYQRIYRPPGGAGD